MTADVLISSPRLLNEAESETFKNPAPATIISRNEDEMVTIERGFSEIG